MIQSNSAPTKRRILVRHPSTRITPIVGITAFALLRRVPSFGATTEWKIDLTKQVVLDVDGPTAPVKDPWGNQRAAVNATSKINRQSFGVKWNATMDNGGVVVGDDV